MNRNIFRKVLAACLALVLICSAGVPGVFAADRGADPRWTLQQGVLTLSGSVTGYDDSNIPWNKAAVTRIVFSEGVSALPQGGDLFAEYPALKTVSIPRSLTDPGYGNFRDCYQLYAFEGAGSGSGAVVREGVLYAPQGDGTLSLLCYPPAKTDSVYILPKDVTNGIDKWSFPAAVSEIQAEAGNPVYFSHDGILYSTEYGFTELACVPEGHYAAVVTFPKELNFISRWQLPRNAAEYRVEAGNRNFTAIDGILYRKEENGSLEMADIPGRYPKTTLTIPKNVTAGVEGHDIPASVRTIQVERGNSCYRVQEGILYEKDADGWRLVHYPRSIVRRSYTVPKDVTSGLDQYSLPEILSEVKVAAGNPVYMAENGILYRKYVDGTLGMDFYPPQKYGRIYTLPQKVSSINCEFPDQISYFKGEKGNPSYLAYGGVLYQREGKYYSLFCYPKARTASVYQIPSKVISGLSDSSFPDCLTAFSISRKNTRYFTLGGVLYHREKGGWYTLAAYPKGRNEQSFSLPAKVRDGVRSDLFPEQMEYLNASASNPFYTGWNGALYRKEKNGSLTMAAYPKGKPETTLYIPEKVMGGVEFAEIPDHIRAFSISSVNPHYAVIAGVLYEKMPDGSRKLLYYPPAGPSSYLIPKSVTSGIEQNLWNGPAVVQTAPGNPVYLAKDNIVYAKRYDGSYALAFYPKKNPSLAAVIDPVCTEINLNRIPSDAGVRSLVLPDTIRSVYSEWLSTERQPGMVCREGGKAEQLCRKNGLSFSGLTGFQPGTLASLTAVRLDDRTVQLSFPSVPWGNGYLIEADRDQSGSYELIDVLPAAVPFAEAEGPCTVLEREGIEFSVSYRVTPYSVTAEGKIVKGEPDYTDLE